MKAHLFPTLKALLHASLVVVFWVIFGHVSVGRFEKKCLLQQLVQIPKGFKCLQSRFAEETRKPRLDGKYHHLKEVFRHMCGEGQNVSKCIEQKTFGQGDIYPGKKIHIVLSLLTLFSIGH